MRHLPRAILLDLDDTILDDSSLVHECWRRACESHAGEFAPLDASHVVEAIRRKSKWFWDDPERHRTGRLDLDDARREVVRLALTELGFTDGDLAAGIGDSYARHRESCLEPFPDAVDTLRWLREAGRCLALITNGAGSAQRHKIMRFGLENLFDAILIEGEMGFGKPDEQVYRRALSVLGVRPDEACMVGDNLEWDVAAPQKLGIGGIWIDVRGAGLPADSPVRPDRIVRALSDLRGLEL